MFSTFGYPASGDAISYSQNPIQSQVAAQSEPKTTKKAKRAKNFSIQEDNLLVSAWLNTTLDPAIGNDQKGAAYWKRIWDYFYAEKNFELECDRNQGSLMHRWSGIQLDVNKFCGYIAEIERTRASGTTEQDRIVEAKQKFRRERGYNFTYEHCWHVLKFHPKWNLELSRKKPKKTHATVPTTSSPITPSASPDTIDLADGNVEGNESPCLERPIGKKAAKTLARKAKAKEKVEAAQSELGDYYALKVEHAHKEDEQFQLMYDAEQENIKLRKQELEIQVRKEDNAIMAIDTSTMEPMRAEYFRGLQQEIIAKRATNGN
ncbi:putative glutathione transferase [Rosa chinensis]|uniref:Putative glutathione transferase n=2 Tax=Rosa chinensis TaxID=74649 RepID=A0A2P6RNB8_ROSCH|nr:putative glutathione transferase [Rosa chinensis]PRQ47927.1 putative glutathione transferase [Rosa chinensis]